MLKVEQRSKTLHARTQSNSSKESLCLWIQRWNQMYSNGWVYKHKGNSWFSLFWACAVPVMKHSDKRMIPDRQVTLDDTIWRCEIKKQCPAHTNNSIKVIILKAANKSEFSNNSHICSEGKNSIFCILEDIITWPHMVKKWITCKYLQEMYTNQSWEQYMQCSFLLLWLLPFA